MMDFSIVTEKYRIRLDLMFKHLILWI